MRRIFGPDGPFAAAFPGYQPRAAQIGLAEAVHHGLETGTHVIAEAGTGTGKSFGGLVPAIHWVCANGGARANKRILVSTAMLILQDQYTRKDLPFLEEHLGIDFEWTKRKGRSNYACDYQMGRADVDRLPHQDRDMFEQVWDWASNTFSGDLAELPFDINHRPKLKKAVTITSARCKGRKCDSYDSCFYYVSKDRAVNCEIIVVNHALLVLNELYDGMILPEYDAVIIDEAHKLEDIVRSNLAEELSLKAFSGLVDAAEALELFSAEKLAELRSMGELHLTSIESTLARIVKWPGKQRFAPGTLPGAFGDWLSQLRDIVLQIWLSARKAAESEAGETPAQDLVVAAEGLGKALRAFIDQDSSYVVWGDRRPGKDGDPDRIVLAQAPIKVGAWMQANLLQKTCIFLSATIATGRGEGAFAPFKEALGIEKAIELQVESPFDYVRNARYSLGYYPMGPDAPPRDQEEWANLIYPRIKLILNLTRGGALVLFTSRKVMDSVFWRLAQEDTEWLMLKQDEMSKDQLITTFKTSMHSVLCATSSFFEGVDIPGNALRCVIIDKIPFPMPSDPIQEAIQESYGRQGFAKHSIPHAITHLKQGVGRLIRSETDRGLLALLDPRFRGTKGYIKQITSQLPGFPSNPAQADEIEQFMREIDLGDSPILPRADLANPFGEVDDLINLEGLSDVV